MIGDHVGIMAHGPKKSQVDEYILERFRMDSYTRTETQLAPEAQRESSPFEMRITTQGKIRNYITYANALLTVCTVSCTTGLTRHTGEELPGNLFVGNG